MSAETVRVVEAMLNRAASDPTGRDMLLESIARSRFFPKYDDGDEPMATPEEWAELRDEYGGRFEDAVDELTAEWGEPYFCGESPDTPDPWGPLGEREACWERGEFAVCLYFGQEDSELPIEVTVAVVRRGAGW